MSAYLIARITVTNPEDDADHAGRTVTRAEKSGGRFLAKGRDQVQVEGKSQKRHVIIEFPDRQAALAWSKSKVYQRSLPIAVSSSKRGMVIIDGY